jgi:hypothetical protein
MTDSTAAQKVPPEVREALISIIEGKNVKRIKHELVWEGKPITPAFIQELQKHGYQPSTVDAVAVEPGERVPGFFIENDIAYFGWVFWEQFTSWRIRKLWGSVIKNSRGDWDIQIPPSRKATIYVNNKMKIEMDIDHPPEF